MAENPPTDNIDALSLFVQGRVLYDSYLKTGDPDDLSEARQCFELAAARDQAFDMAKLYHGVSEADAGNAKEAVKILGNLNQSLTEKKAELPQDQRKLEEMQLNVRVQLGIAAAKGADYGKAVGQLRAAERDTAERDASKNSLIKAYSTLFSALGYARDGDKEGLARVCKEADDLAEGVSKKRSIALETRFEAATAAGTAHMLLSELHLIDEHAHVHAGEEPTHAEEERERAETQLRSASALCPDSSRPLYSLATLYMAWGDHDKQRQEEWYNKSKDLVARTLELTPNDELVRATMAILEAKTGDRKKAEEHAKRLKDAEFVKQQFHLPSTRKALSQVIEKQATTHSPLAGYVDVAARKPKVGTTGSN